MPTGNINIRAVILTFSPLPEDTRHPLLPPPPPHHAQITRLAAQVQKRLRREMRAALSVADVLLAPTTPFPPFGSSGGAPADPASLLLNDVLTVPVSLTGVPAISIPVATAPVPARATTAAAAAAAAASSSGVRFSGRGWGGRSPLAPADGGGGGGGEPCHLPLGMQVGWGLTSPGGLRSGGVDPGGE